MIVSCTQCKKEGQFDVELTFTYGVANCSEHQLHMSEWSFSFCDVHCMLNWLDINDVKNQGFPCQSCHGSGWFAGFEQNGPCDVCNGTKRVSACVNKM